jgi:hypothetical protein
MSAQTNDQLTLKIHGLQVDNDFVRADIFIGKLAALLRALKQIDKVSHGKARHEYVVSDLKIGSALATLREKPKSLRHMPRTSSVLRLSDAISAIHDGRGSVTQDLTPELLTQVGKLASGSSEKFSFAELSFPGGKVIRIDDFLANRVENLERTYALEAVQQITSEKYYVGTALGSFQGYLKALDSRGTLLRGKLILSAGGAELDCVMNMEELPTAIQHFDSRVTVQGLAHYEAHSPLPVRIEIRHLAATPPAADLTKWRGALRVETPDHADDGWH